MQKLLEEVEPVDEPVTLEAVDVLVLDVPEVLVVLVPVDAVEAILHSPDEWRT